MNIKIKKLNDKAVIPSYAKPGDGGLDLTAISEEIINDLDMRTIRYGTGLAFEIPPGHIGLLFPRSSITSKTTFSLGNSVGVIDSSYRGEVKFEFRELSRIKGKKYNVGDRIGQLIIIPYPEINLIEVDELSTTERGEGSFGSTGK